MARKKKVQMFRIITKDNNYDKKKIFDDLADSKISPKGSRGDFLLPKTTIRKKGHGHCQYCLIVRPIGKTVTYDELIEGRVVKTERPSAGERITSPSLLVMDISETEEEDIIYQLPNNSITYSVAENALRALIEERKLETKFWLKRWHDIDIRDIQNKNIGEIFNKVHLPNPFMDREMKDAVQFLERVNAEFIDFKYKSREKKYLKIDDLIWSQINVVINGYGRTKITYYDKDDQKSVFDSDKDIKTFYTDPLPNDYEEIFEWFYKNRKKNRDRLSE